MAGDNSADYVAPKPPVTTGDNESDAPNKPQTTPFVPLMQTESLKSGAAAYTGPAVTMAGYQQMAPNHVFTPVDHDPFATQPAPSSNVNGGMFGA